MRSNGEPDRSLMIEENPGDSMQIDPKSSRYSCCIVWSPLPVLSCLFPCIGHIGICREDGVILDFAGPNFVCVDNFTFGSPTRYIQLNKEQCFAFINSSGHDSEDESKENGGRSDIMTWDYALRKSTQEYQHHSYNLLTCNCHSFVANCLNKLKFQAGGWNVVNLAILIFLKGQWGTLVAVTFWCFIFAGFLLWVSLRRQIKKAESVIIFAAFGVQLKTMFKRKATRKSSVY